MAELASTPWPSALHDINNTGRSPYVASQTNSLKWAYYTGAMGNMGPVIGSDGTVYMPSNTGLNALDPNGTRKWVYTTTSSAIKTPVIGSDGTIYFGDGNKWLFALNQDGTKKWSIQLPSVGAIPAIGPDGTIYFGTSNLSAINPDGTVKWDYPTGTIANGCPSIAPDGTIYIGSNSGKKLYALNPDGSLKWTFPSAGQIMGSAAIGSDGTVFFGSLDKNLTAVNPDGSLKWQYKNGTASFYGSPTIGADGTIYIGSYGNNNIYAINPDGTYKWSYLTGNKIYDSVAIGADGTLYMGSYDKVIYALDPDGNQKWSYTTGGTIGDPPAIGADGALYIGSNDGYLYAFTGVVNFTADQPAGAGPLTVQFTGTSPLTVTAWNWDFGDGTTSTDQNPSHTYSSVGYYSVNLSITHADGTNYLRQTDYIKVYSPPVADFTADTMTGTFPLTISFTDASTGNPTSWAWDFGDSTTSTDQNPSHTYSTAGTYTVNLTAVNAGGSNLTSRSGYISVLTPSIPIASFTAHGRAGLAPVTIQFNDTSTWVPTSWLWDFGDGTTSTDRNATHTYTITGTYTVNLTATNTQGSNTNSSTDYIAVLDQQELSNYHFINVYVANDEGVKYDVPDGAAASGGTYSYVPNTYWVMFRQAGGGLNALHISSTSSATTAADITSTTNQSGSFWITFSGGQPSMPEGVLMLAVNGTIPDDFGVHIRSSGIEFDPGTPGITNQGLPTETTFLDGAVDQTFHKNDFLYGPQSWKPSSSSGYALYNEEDQADPINQFQLMFIDLRVGAVQNSSLTNNGMIKVEYSFTNLSSTAVFNTYGWYMQCNHGTGIIMTNDITSSGYTVRPSERPVAGFSAGTTSGAANTAIQFTDASTGSPASWSWNFGDGSTSTLQNPSHTYTTAGTYTVTLTATNSKGSDTMTKQEYIAVTEPLPDYNDIYVTVANNAGVKYNAFSNDTYHILFQGSGQGLNALHISTDPSVNFGQVTRTGEQAGSFYATDSGGKGYEDEIILMVAVNGTIPDDFRLNIKSDGYTWTPNTVSNTAPDISTVSYQPVALDETFNGSDFKYGPQIWKPTGDGLSYPIYSGQDMTDTTNTFQIMFVDLNAGVLRPNTSMENQGAVRINYSFQNLGGSIAAFSVYGYCKYSNSGNDVIGWSNALTPDKTMSGYTVTGSSPGPVASFTADATAVIANTAVQFTDTSTNTPTSWSWNFGDGSTSTSQNPSHTYTTAGTYTVTLTATNSLGSNTLTRSNYITVSAAGTPAVGFTATPVNGIKPLSVQFTDTSTNTPTSWSWDFGDGSTSTSKNPSHTYSSAGTYDVSLTISNAAGSNNLTKNGLVYVTSSAGALPGHSDIFIRTANHEGIRWNTNNNGTYYISPLSSGSGLSGIHLTTDPAVNAGQVTETENQTGTFYVTPNAGGSQDEIVLLLGVTGTIPDDFSARIKTSGYTWTPTGSAPSSGSYTYQSSALDETFTRSDFLYGPQNWKPTAGDADYPLFSGQDMASSKNQYMLMFIDTRAGALGDSSLTNNGAVKVEYSFTNLPSTATFNVYSWKSGQGMEWTNALTGAAASGYRITTAAPTEPPVAAFTSNQTEGLAPFNARFRDASTNTPTSWSWDFGDGSTSTSQNPTHTYSTTGTYTVKLTASNRAGSDQVTRTGYITVSAPVETTNSFALAGIQAETNGTVQNVTISSANATTSGNTVTVTGVGSTWDHLAITMNETPANDGTNLTGFVSSVQAVTVPVTVPIASLGNPEVSLDLNLALVPNSTAAITSTLSSDPHSANQSSFSVAAANAGDQITATAYTVYFTKSGIENAGSGGIITNATITMTVSPSWVSANGGTSHIVIMHRSDSGTTTILTTTYVRTDASGNYVFQAVSPTGLSTFVLAAVEPVPATSSGLDSSSSGSDDFTSTGRTSTVMATMPGLTLGETATLTFDQALTSGHPAGISTIQIVPKKSIGSTQVYVRDTSSSDVLEITGRPVAGISQIQMTGVNPSSVDHAVILFALSGAWMRENDLTPTDVVMLRDYNAEWTELPTKFDHLDGDTYYFSATTPGFSYFAVAGRVPAGVTATAAPTIAAAVSTAQPLATPTLAVKPTTTSTTSVPVAMQATPNTVPQSSAAKGWNPLIVAGAFVTGIVLVSVSVAAFLKRWKRRRDPLR